MSHPAYAWAPGLTPLQGKVSSSQCHGPILELNMCTMGPKIDQKTHMYGNKSTSMLTV